jgi:hypothetical protein
VGKLKKSQFRFRKNETVGAEGAEQDEEFLGDCFYDQGDLDALRDCAKPTCIVVGRTGAGKTALLMELVDKEEHAIQLEPESLSLQYLSNSTILKYLDDLGVNLDLFYKLLWRHVFAVELIKEKWKIKSEADKNGFLQWVLSLLPKNKAREKAINYLVEWGQKFWEDTEYRIHEVTHKLEEDVKASLGAKAHLLEGSIGTARHLTTEEKAEVKQRAQSVVNSIQMKKLSDVINVLAEEVFNHPQPRYYIVIDKLDENWVDESVRHYLIRALIETAKDFGHRIQSVKIVLALRKDLLERVIRNTRDVGFQEEKYRPLYLYLKWSREQLFELLNSRVNKLIKRQYTQQEVSWHDVTAAKVDKAPIEDFLIERTMYRPRDVIVFFNTCIAQAVDRPEITVKMIRVAEAEYSAQRFQSLADEWSTDYPELLDFASLLLKKRPARFLASALSVYELEEKCLQVAVDGCQRKGILSQWASSVAEKKLSPDEFRARLLTAFYEVGLLGIKTETYTSVSWSFLNESITPAQIRDDSSVQICPVFYRVLGINPLQS